MRFCVPSETVFHHRSAPFSPSIPRPQFSSSQSYSSRIQVHLSRAMAGSARARRRGRRCYWMEKHGDTSPGARETARRHA